MLNFRLQYTTRKWLIAIVNLKTSIKDKYTLSEALLKYLVPTESKTKYKNGLHRIKQTIFKFT